MAERGLIGFIGLGIMGRGMASNLAKAGMSLIVWNRDTNKARMFVEEFGGQIAEAPQDVIQRCDITYTMLSTPEADKSVYFSEDGILSGVTSGKTIVDCATLTPEVMVELNTEVRPLLLICICVFVNFSRLYIGYISRWAFSRGTCIWQ